MQRTVRGSVEDLWKKRDGARSARHGRGLRWRARYVNEYGREISKAFRLKDEANTWLIKETAAVVGGTHVDPRTRRITLATYYEDWSSRQVWESGTQEVMDLSVKFCSFRNVPFGELEKQHVQRWVKEMQQTLKPSTIQTRFANVHNVLLAAVEEKKLAHNPALNLRRTLPTVSRDMAIPTPEELGLILSSATLQFGTMIALGAFAGLRQGEICGLKISDIDFLRQEIHIRRQVQRATGRPMEIRPPKYNSARDIYAPEELLLALSRYIELRSPRAAESEWLFASTMDGMPPYRQTVAQWFRKTRDAVGLKGYTLHDTRHYYASGLIAQGCDVVTVQHALGHKSPKVTLDTYAQLWPKADDRTRKAAAALFQQTISPAGSADAR